MGWVMVFPQYFSLTNTTFLSHLAHFLFVLKNRGGRKFWKKYKLQEITIDGNHLGINQIEIQETFQNLLKRDDSKWAHVL